MAAAAIAPKITAAAEANPDRLIRRGLQPPDEPGLFRAHLRHRRMPEPPWLSQNDRALSRRAYSVREPMRLRVPPECQTWRRSDLHPHGDQQPSFPAAPGRPHPPFAQRPPFRAAHPFAAPVRVQPARLAPRRAWLSPIELCQPLQLQTAWTARGSKIARPTWPMPAGVSPRRAVPRAGRGFPQHRHRHRPEGRPRRTHTCRLAVWRRRSTRRTGIASCVNHPVNRQPFS